MYVEPGVIFDINKISFKLYYVPMYPSVSLLLFFIPKFHENVHVVFRRGICVLFYSTLESFA